MSEFPETEATEGDDDDRLRSLVRGALKKDEGEAPDVLAGFQKKLRERSGGKFYADGWSTSRNPPEFTYLVTGILMLIALIVIASMLSIVLKPERVQNEPAPVNVVAPARK